MTGAEWEAVQSRVEGEQEVGEAGKHISDLVPWLDHDRWLLIRTGVQLTWVPQWKCHALF